MSNQKIRIGNSEIIDSKGNLFEVIRKYRIINRDIPKDLLMEIKSFLKTDTILKLEDKIFFCRKIETLEETEIEYIDE